MFVENGSMENGQYCVLRYEEEEGGDICVEVEGYSHD
jgi:hypothetical protein